MAFTEHDFEHHDEHSQSQECADCKQETCAKLAELQQDIIGVDNLPPPVLNYVTTNISADKQGAALQRVAELQIQNPNLFNVPINLLPTILTSILGESEIAALDTKEKSIDLENANFNQEIEAKRKANDLRRATVDTLSDEVQLEDIARTDPNLKDLSGRALIDTLYRLSFVQERPELQNRLTMISKKLDAIQGVAANPAEAQALENIIGQSTLYFGADNPADIFTDVLARADSDPNLSEATKVKVHELFNIPTIKTAADIQTVLNQGYGIDGDGERMPFTQDNKARVFENTYVYETPSGERRFQVNLPDGRNLNIAFDGETNTQALGDLIYTTQIMFEMEKISLAEPIFQRGWNITHGGTIDLHFDDIITAKRIGSTFLGGTSGHDAQLLTSKSQNRMGHNFQAFPSKGDAAEGDNNADRALADYRELTIINEDGTVNWTKFEKAGLYLQGITAKGGQPNFLDLKNHLTESEAGTV